MIFMAVLPVETMREATMGSSLAIVCSDAARSAVGYAVAQVTRFGFRE
jgi:hypothetical protein